MSSMHSLSSRISLRAISVVVSVALLAVSGCTALHLVTPGPSVIEPNIVPATGEAGSQTVSRAFDFEDLTLKLSVPVNRAVYRGSVTAQKSAIFLDGKQPPNWVAGYYRAFINEKHQAAFYASMLEALRAVRERDHLDSARYIELITCMSQELEYRTDPVNLAPKFPIETFGDGFGDCDDKTLLAAALLSQEGFDVAIFLFAPEKHVALGVRAPGLDYKETGYAYVEMTQPSLVGVPAEELAGGIHLTSQPEVIKIGAGEGTFSAGAQIAYIERRLSELRAAEKRLKTQIDSDQAELTDMKSKLEDEKRSLDSIRDPASLSAAIAQYNQHVGAYNDLAAQLRALVARYNELIDVDNYVLRHQYARPQVYSRLRGIAL